MADSSTPNLLGASEGFNELANQLSSIKSFLQGALEAPIETVVAELIGSLGILDGDFSALIPELSSIADISFISEIQNLIALDAGSLSSLSALANIESQFGDVLSGAGFDLGGIISDATGALSGTFDDLTGGILDQVTGIVDSTTGDILGQVTGVADNLVGGLIGQVTGGVADIVDSATGDILGQVTGIADNLTGGIVGQAAGLVSQGLNAEGIADNLVGGLVGQVTSVVGEIGGITEEFVGLSDFDIVNLNIPNFAIGLDGIPTLLASAAGMPAGDPVDEDGATLTTPAAEISSVNAPINLDVSVAAEKIQGAIANIQVVIASESGFISNKTIFAYDEADVVAKTAAIKAKTTTTPQSTKVKDAVLTNKTLPPKTPAIKLTGEAAVEMESLKVLQDEVAEFENELIGEYERLSHLLLKYKQKSPHNLTADAKRQIVFDKKTKLAPARFLGSSLGGKKDINQFYKFYQTQITRAKLKIEDINDQITKRIDFIQGGLLTSITTEIDGETIIRRIIAADKEQSINDRFVAYKKNDGDELIKSMDIAYEEAEKTFSIPRR
jgi:hypothetical protein